MNTLDEWTAQLIAEFGLDAESMNRDVVLDVTKDVAHSVARPAAPLTAFLLGVAVGGGVPLSDAAARIGSLAKRYEQRSASRHGDEPR